MAADKKLFRCLAVTRYAVASVVTVLIVVVVIKAIRVVCRPRSLYIGVAQGAVFRRRLEHPTRLRLLLSLQFYNPSIRTVVYYTNITAYLFDKNTPPWSPNPGPDSLVYFLLQHQALHQQVGWEDTFVYVEVVRGITIEASVFDSLNNRKTDAYMHDITMRLDGTLITEIRSGFNTTPRFTTFYCWPLFLGLDLDTPSFNLKDVFCRETMQDTHFI